MNGTQFAILDVIVVLRKHVESKSAGLSQVVAYQETRLIGKSKCTQSSQFSTMKRIDQNPTDNWRTHKKKKRNPFWATIPTLISNAAPEERHF